MEALGIFTLIQINAALQPESPRPGIRVGCRGFDVQILVIGLGDGQQFGVDIGAAHLARSTQRHPERQAQFQAPNHRVSARQRRVGVF